MRRHAVTPDFAALAFPQLFSTLRYLSHLLSRISLALYSTRLPASALLTRRDSSRLPLGVGGRHRGSSTRTITESELDPCSAQLGDCDRQLFPFHSYRNCIQPTRHIRLQTLTQTSTPSAIYFRVPSANYRHKSSASNPCDPLQAPSLAPAEVALSVPCPCDALLSAATRAWFRV